jgi:hypothetical protein
MSGAEWVDDGFRLPRHMESPEGPSRAEERAEKAAPGAWDESLGRWGSEEWNLPGQGERGPRCGEWYPEAVCETCGEVDLGTHSCGRRSCPDCWGIWGKEAAVRATVRIQAFRETQPNDHRRQVAHTYVSPEEGEVMNEREFYEGRTRAAEIAREKGMRGCAVIPHPYRATTDAKERYRREDPDYGIWVWLRNDVEEMEEWVYWSPHYHVIGVTTEDMEPAKESDEWVYQFKRSLERYEGTRDGESHEDLYGLFRYLLSHTGFVAGSTKQATTWYGDLANSVFVEEATEEWQHEKPSEGVRSVLKREVEEIAGVSIEEEGEVVQEESGEQEACPSEECDGFLVDVFDVSAFLRQRDPGGEVADRMQAARDWRLGRIEPPPGLKRPRTEEEASEALEALL